MKNKNNKDNLKKLDIFNMTEKEVEEIYIKSKRDLLELLLKSKKEYMSDFPYKKNMLRRNIARCMMYISNRD